MVARARTGETTMRTRSIRTCALRWVAVAALVAAGCRGNGPAEPKAAQAPRGAAALSSGANCPAADVHARHVNLFACTTCHPTGATYGFDVPYRFAGGTTTAGGTIVPRTGTAPTTCSVACHFPKGAAPRPVTWDAPGPLACTECHTAPLPARHPAVASNATRAECQACHLAASHMDGAVALVGHPPEWITPADPSNAQFHASAANRGIAECQKCHGQALTGGPTGVSCAGCHDANLPAGVASWTVHCTMCHGGLETAGGAPPEATWGNAGDVIRVGAHTRHVSGSPIAPPFDCDACHVKPADALAAGHLDGTVADVRFAGLAIAGGVAPSWDRGAGTCASTYCHGATLAGGTLKTPRWTVLDGTQAACGTCHGTPPAGAHPAVSGELAACNPCHPATMDPAGGIIPPSSGGKHLDGVIEAAGHTPEWTDPASGGFHAFSANRGLEGCRSCHGADLAGGTAGVGCGGCHDRNLPAGVATWSRNCTMCHGGTNDATGAPPKATWGNAGDAVRIGAHGLHVARAIDCGTCHVKPDDALSAGHVDGPTATVTFSGLAIAGGLQPVWSRAGATCASTYCHGSFTGGNAAYAPVWTAPSASACGTCHGLPPGGTHPASAACGSCHDGYTATSVNAALHVNGAVDVLSLTCTSCHGDRTRAATAQNPQLAAAPPLDASGNEATSAPGVGAHQRHLQAGAAGNAMTCTECHGVPASMTHANGTADVAFGPLATASGALSPAWDGAALTCASTYCHGSFRGGNAANAPVWTAARASACGTCHGAPPPASTGHPQNASCGGCHRGYTQVSVNAATHLDGRVDVSGGACTSCHGDETRAATALNPALPYAPPVDTTGSSDPASPGVGAHRVHLEGSALRGPLTCTECHVVPADMASHPSGTAELTWGPLATGAISASVAVTTGARHFESFSVVTPGYAAGACSSAYCHGAYSGVYAYPSYDWDLEMVVTKYVPYSGVAAAPSWTGGPTTCGSCHAPGGSFVGVWHSGSHGGGNDCSLCHPDASGVAPTAAITDPALHVDGKVDLAVGWKSSCIGCH
jgi:predicted CxxxxCH...CXXCH cytochrome family protein